VADTAGLGLAAANVETDPRGFVRVDPHLSTSSPHIFAAGDVTGSLLLVSRAVQEGFVAGTNAVLGRTLTRLEGVTPVGSFTDPEYAQVGMTEKSARSAHDVVTAVQRFDAATRTIIDGRTLGFCKLIADRPSGRILGCHVVGDRAVDIVQVAAVAMAGGLDVYSLARLPLSFPTYAGILGRAAASVAHQIRQPARPLEPIEA
jgi:pyruvate/2-oxoglutarate dehydrogenase complex dihydrolipoamide dehydrogenase (E3) component